MKLIDIVNSENGLKSIDKMILPLGTTRIISEQNIKIYKEIAFYNKEKEKYCIEYGETTDNLNYKIKQENLNDFSEKMNALNNDERQIEKVKIQLSDKLALSPENFRILSNFFEIEVV